MTAKTAADLKPFARKMLDGFAMIPTDWLSTIAAKIDGDGWTAMPAHGSCFIVHDSYAAWAIEALLTPFVPKDQEKLLAFIDDEQLGIDVSEYLIEPHALDQLGDAANDEPELALVYDLDLLREEALICWDEFASEDRYLSTYGWNKVGKTGLIAREFDGHLVLGINGGGYDFFEAHWIPLYKEIGYGWHKVEV